MDIVYRFIASGQGEVERAFTGIESAAKRQKKAVDDAQKATRAASAPAGTRQRASVEDRAAKAQERSAARAAAAQERSAKKAADAQIKQQERVAKSAEKWQKQQGKYEQDRLNRQQKRIEQAAKAERAARDHARRESGAGRAKTIGRLADLGMGAGIGLAMSAAAVAGAAAKESMELQEASARIAIASRRPGEKARDASELRRGFERTAMNAPGVKSAEVADAVARFVSLTGDVDTALKSQGTFATIATASGSNIGDIAEAAASLSQQFDIKGIEDMQGALAALTFQGKEGSFELKDAAAQFQRLAASGAAFGIPKGAGGVKTLGGLTQIARSGTGSAEQAATAVENLLTNLKVKQKELGRAGVDVFDKSGKARDVRDLIVESISKVGGADMAKKSMGLTQIFGEQGIRAINPLVAKYTAAFQAAQGTDEQKTAAGIAALRAEIERSINAPGDWADVQDDAALAQKNASAQMTAAWESIKSVVGDTAVPAITDLATALGPFASALKKDFVDTTEVKRAGSKGEADKAQARIWEIEGLMSAAGIAEKDLDPTMAAELKEARSVRDAYAVKEAKAKQFQNDVLLGKTPVGAAPGPLTREDYVKQQAQAELDAGWFGPESDPWEVLAAQERAGAQWDELQKTGGKTGGFMSNFFDPAADMDLYNRASVAAGGEGDGSVQRNKLDTNGAQDALDSFAKKLAGIQVPQGSIVPGADAAVR